MDNKTVFESNSEKDTFSFAMEMAKGAAAGDVFLLNGDLGVGKTVFAKGFAKGMGIEDVVASPTFTIMQLYSGSELNLYHFDAYRIEDPDEIYDIGFTDYIGGDGICLIEWAQNIAELIPEDAVSIEIEKDLDKGFDYRRITISNGR